MASNVLIDKDEQGVKIVITKHRSIIGSVIYLIVSRPDIMFRISMCA